MQKKAVSLSLSKTCAQRPTHHGSTKFTITCCPHVIASAAWQSHRIQGRLASFAIASSFLLAMTYS
jgi:hypothetical protein